MMLFYMYKGSFICHKYKQYNNAELQPVLEWRQHLLITQSTTTASEEEITLTKDARATTCSYQHAGDVHEEQIGPCLKDPTNSKLHGS